MNLRFFIAIVPIFFLIMILAMNVHLFSDASTSGPNQLALIMASIVAGILSMLVDKTDYSFLEQKVVETISTALKPCLILAIVGILIASWIMAGVVPAMIYYGVKMIHPLVFLPVSCLICVVVATATGSSWSTAGTIGVALMGVGGGLGISPSMVAGAVISGAYFGDKMSPLSDTTNLAPAIAGTELFTHIRFMMQTTVPAILISLILFGFLGYYSLEGFEGEKINLESFLLLLERDFWISPVLFFPPLLVGILVRKKISALLALTCGVVAGILLLPLQGEVLYKDIILTLYHGFQKDLGSDYINSLLHQGGLVSMFNTIALIVSAMIFGGVMQGAGYLNCIAQVVLRGANSVFSLVSMTLGAGVFLNMTASDQYLSIVVTGEIFKDSYRDKSLAPELLSRTMEDGATVTSVLIPWNTCGAYFATVLGVATFEYLPYCFFNLLCPIFSAILGYRISKKYLLQRQ